MGIAHPRFHRAIHGLNYLHTDEAFFTGTAVEVTPIRELDDRRIGDGSPGPITRRLQDLFFRVVQGREHRYRTWLAPV